MALIDTSATTETQAMYAKLQYASGKYIYFGQFFTKSETTFSGSPYEETYISSQSLAITGRQPYIYHVGYYTDFWRNIIEHDTTLKTHYATGGMIMVSWFMRNWVSFQSATLWTTATEYTVGDYVKDSGSTTYSCLEDHTSSGTGIGTDFSAGKWKYDGDVSDISGDPVVNVLPGGSARATYLSALDDFATWASNFKDTNGDLIPFMFRPFHENDGSWNWWGIDTCTEAQFVSLWQDLVTYLKDTKGLHQIIYVYSPEIINGYDYDGALYPGDDYVDVLGLDWYANTITTAGTGNQGTDNGIERLQAVYDLAIVKNKPFGLTEGLRNLGLYPLEDYWTTYFIDPILADDKAKYSSFIVTFNSIKEGYSGYSCWGPQKGSLDEASFLEVSNNQNIRFLDYEHTTLKNCTLLNCVLH